MARLRVPKFSKISLMMSYHAVSIIVLVISMIVIGTWVSNRIESGIIERVGHTTALFVDSFIAPHVLAADNSFPYTPEVSSELDTLLYDTPLGNEVVALKIWNPEGMVVYSSEASETGKIFPIEAGLSNAWEGIVSAEISDLRRTEHNSLREYSERLLEIYSPIWEHGTGKIAAVAEFYQLVEAIEAEVRSARSQGWMVDAAVIGFIYLSLSILFYLGNRTIRRQQDELEARVVDLNSLLSTNIELNRRARAAAMRATDLNERYLRRIAADLHDGPAQDISYSLLTLDKKTSSPDNGETITTSLERALREIRHISSGLQSPEVENLDIPEIVKRAVRIHSSRTGADVDVEVGEIPKSAPLAAKIALYRVLQEALSNAYRHAGDAKPRVHISSDGGTLQVEIADRGPGRAGKKLEHHGTHLGLQIMRERIELLGSSFDVEEYEAEGTKVRVQIPVEQEIR
jgi:signal transduction histidine kinase